MSASVLYHAHGIKGVQYKSTLFKNNSIEVIAIQDGQRESALSWRELLLSLSRRGLEMAPSLAVGDGALGFWKALEEVYSSTKQQRCWVHKTANILDKMPESVQKGAKMMIHEMYLSPTKEADLDILN